MELVAAPALRPAGPAAGDVNSQIDMLFFERVQSRFVHYHQYQRSRLHTYLKAQRDPADAQKRGSIPFCRTWGSTKQQTLSELCPEDETSLCNVWKNRDTYAILQKIRQAFDVALPFHLLKKLRCQCNPLFWSLGIGRGKGSAHRKQRQQQY